MLVLTLLGTVATIVSVLVAMGVGPFDVTGGSGAGGGGAKSNGQSTTDPSRKDDGKEVQTAATFVDAINRICSDKLDDITRRVTELNQAVADEDLAKVGLSLNQASTELSALTTRIKGVRLPADPNEAKPLQEWRDMYEGNVEVMSKASGEWTNGDYQAASATLEAADSDKVEAKGDEVHIACP
jgi:hypothetical protein